MQDSNLLKKESLKKYQRPVKNVPLKSIKDKKLKGNLKKADKKSREAVQKAIQSELLLTQESG